MGWQCHWWGSLLRGTMMEAMPWIFTLFSVPPSPSLAPGNVSSLELTSFGSTASSPLPSPCSLRLTDRWLWLAPK